MATLASMRTRARASGFSLIELMIAMTLSLMVLAAIGWVYFGTMRTYKSHDSLSRMQESARYAFEVIGKDLRMIGAAGCSYSTSANVLNTNTDWYKNLFGQALSGAEQDGTGETQYSDSLRVVRADVAREYVVLAHNSVGAQFTLTAASDLTSGQLMLATDCTNAAVFQATSASSANVSHAASGTPGNSTINLGPLAAAYTYGAGTRLYRLHSAVYYVDNNSVGVPSLFRKMPAGSTAALTAEELVEGVEDMQVAYGVDTTPTPDGEADFVDPDGDGDPYLTAAQLDDAASPVPGGNAAARWQRVVSVRISLLIRTVEDRVVPSTQTYRYNGADITAPDLRLRKVFTHVIKVRNR